MGSGKRLSDYEKGQIMAFRKSNYTLYRISKEIGRSRGVIRKFLQNPKGYGTKKHTGRKPKLSPWNQRDIESLASNSTKSCAKIAADLHLNVDRSTINRAITRSEHIVSAKLKLKPALNEGHKRAREEFARQHASWTQEWQQV